MFFSARNTTKTASAPAAGVKKTSGAEIRIKKDLLDLTEERLKESNLTLKFLNPDDILNFEVTIRPDGGYWKGGEFQFKFTVPTDYPITPPKILCVPKIYHPNIDLEGKVCLNILREEWQPVLTISTVIYGLQHLFLEPNVDDPLNKIAADVLDKTPEKFEKYVYSSMRGGYVDGVQFVNVMAK